MKEPQRVGAGPQNSILVIVDMENEFCKPGGKKFRPERAATMPAVVSAIQGLAERARHGGIPVIYIQSVRTLKEPEFTVFGMEPSLVQDTWGVEIIPELTPHEEDIIVQKHTHDPFYQTELDRVLARLVPEPTRCQAIVTGGGVSTCVRHAVMGFYLRDYWTIVPVDCVVYTLEADRQNAFEHFSQHGYPNIFLSRSDLIEISPASGYPSLIPGR